MSMVWGFGRSYRNRENPNTTESQELGSSGAGFSAYIMVFIIVFLPAIAFAFYIYNSLSSPQNATSPTNPGRSLWMAVFFLAEILAGLLLVARWFQRLTSNSDIEELRKMAYSYRLGGSLALRPFLNSDGEKLEPNSTLASYRKGIIEPNFYKSASNPPFLLAITLVVSLGLFSFFAFESKILSIPSVFLLGPELGHWKWPNSFGDETVNGTELGAFMAYAARALVCVSFAFAGSLVWAVIYLTRRMALRDVTGHTYQELSMRLVVSAVVSLVVYHLFATSVSSGKAPSSEVLLLLSFGTGIMPETVIRWVGNKSARLFGSAEQNDHIDLEHIHGINTFIRSRLAEVGVYDAQGLIATNPLRLSLHTPFSLPQLLDWYGQAFILLYFQPNGVQSLRNLGIRTIWEAEAACSIIKQQNISLGAAGTLGDALERVLQAIRCNPCYVRATQIHKCMVNHAAMCPSAPGTTPSQPS